MQLSAAEQRGLLLFADPNKGNCAACHIAAPGADGSAPLFTDYTFANLGLPRNPKIAANADPLFYGADDAPIGVDLVATALTATQHHFAYCWRRPDGTYAPGRVEHDAITSIHFTPERVRLREAA